MAYNFIRQRYAIFIDNAERSRDREEDVSLTSANMTELDSVHLGYRTYLVSEFWYQHLYYDF